MFTTSALQCTIGNGMAIFKDLDRTQPLALVKAASFGCGIVLLKYGLKRG